MRSHFGLGLDLSAWPLVTGMFPLIRCLGVTCLKDIRLPGHLYHSDDYCNQRTQQGQRHSGWRTPGAGFEVVHRAGVPQNTLILYQQNETIVHTASARGACLRFEVRVPSWVGDIGTSGTQAWLLKLQPPRRQIFTRNSIVWTSQAGWLRKLHYPEKKQRPIFWQRFLSLQRFLQLFSSSKKPHRSTSIIKWLVY